MEAFFIIVAVGAFGAAIVYGRYGKERHRHVWAEVAAARGGTHSIFDGWFNRGTERIEVVVGGVAVTVETQSGGGVGQREAAYTRVRAPYAFGPGPRFRIYREGVLTSIGKALGDQDVVLGGHAAFDRHFMVSCDEPALVRRLWTPAAMDAMLAGFPQATVSADVFTLELSERGIWTDPGKIHAALDLVGELAARDLRGETALRAIRGAAFGSSAGRPWVELDVPVRVTISTEDVGGQLATVARLAEDPGADPLVLAIDPSGRPEDRALASKLPQGAHVHLSRTGAGTLHIEPGATRFVWPDVELDPERLRAGAELLGALRTGGPGGVFR
jgi:hypothetical protein